MTSVVKTKSGQKVFPLHKSGNQWTLCLFPYEQTSKKGNRGIVQPVRDENLIYTKEFAG